MARGRGRHAAAALLLALAALAALAGTARAVTGKACKAVPGCTQCDLVEKGGEDSYRVKVVCTQCANEAYRVTSKGRRCGEFGRASERASDSLCVFWGAKRGRGRREGGS